MRSFSRAVLVVATGIVATSANAIDLPVAYLIDFKEFKKNVVAGAPLSFDLHAESDCSGSAVYGEMKFAGATDVIAEKVTQQRAKGQKPSPPRGIRLSTTLAPSSVGEQLFLKVTGDGIVPLESDCQPQVSAIPGPPGDPSEVMHLFDGDGNDLGVSIGGGSAFYDESIDAIVALTPTTGEYGGGGGVWFESNDCTGQAYVKAFLVQQFIFSETGSEWVGDISAITTRQFQSQLSGSPHVCILTSNMETVVTATPVSSGFTFPFPLPLYLAPGTN